jgi:hypothetical protein
MHTKKIIALACALALSLTACSKSSGSSASGGNSGNSGGGKSLNSTTELKAYLDSQSANGPDKPIKIAMKANDQMIKDIAKVITDAGKYVSLDLSGSPLTTIPDGAFNYCTTLAGIIIPNGVTRIGNIAFSGCTSLTSITIPSTVTAISAGAFMLCTGLASITIPASVTTVGEFTFNYWTASQTITIEGKANRAATITAGWHEEWDTTFGDEAPAFNYGK